MDSGSVGHASTMYKNGVTVPDPKAEWKIARGYR
jgi:hypothetical protein